MKLKFIKLAIFSRLHVLYDHAQMNYRVNRALVMETCQSKNYTIFFNAIPIDFSVTYETSRKSYSHGW